MVRWKELFGYVNGMPINFSVPCRCMHIVIDSVLGECDVECHPPSFERVTNCHPKKGQRAELSIGDPIEAVSGQQIADFFASKKASWIKLK